MIKRELIQFDLETADQHDFFDHAVDELLRLGYVKESFREAIKAREARFPTALPLQPEAVAIPHSDPEHLNEPFILAARLAAPVTWNEMGRNEAEHPVRLIFMLGFTRSDGHVKLLQVLLQNLQDAEFMKALSDATTAQEYFDIVHAMRGFEE
ncbi:MAG: PTS sugar transporter subunit IIA [Propioniciclava sp.]|uniref:PTS sugar transporter subunit IIA n=1 Tax=Propioniciclava sp. TaxID=2038686 RepID=UPI0039E49EFA